VGKLVTVRSKEDKEDVSRDVRERIQASVVMLGL